MATRRRNPKLLTWLWEEVSGKHARQDLLRMRVAAPRRQPAGKRATTRRTVPKTRPYKVVVKDTHTARTRPYQVVRSTEEFADLADRAERGELKGEALQAFLNTYQVARRKG